MCTSCCSPAPARAVRPPPPRCCPDILDIARGTQRAAARCRLGRSSRLPAGADEGARGRLLHPTKCQDVPGAFAAIATRMGEAGISLESVIQRPDLRVSEPGVVESEVRTVVLLTQSTLEQIGARCACAASRPMASIRRRAAADPHRATLVPLTPPAAGEGAHEAQQDRCRPRRRHIDRSLTLELVRVTEAAAIASAAWRGKGDEKAADDAAVEAMRTRAGQRPDRGPHRHR